jgi:hypothetical protein
MAYEVSFMGMPAGGGGGPLTIDTSTSAVSSGTTAVLSVSTGGTNRLVVVMASKLIATVSGVSGSTLGAFTKIGEGQDGSGSASIWAKLASSQLSGETVTATFSDGTFSATAVAITFSGPKSTSVLATNFGTPSTLVNSSSTVAAMTINATAAGSYILAAMIDVNGSSARTLRGDTTRIVADVTDGGGDLQMFHRCTSATAGSGSVTVGTTAPTGIIYAAAVEVLSG